MKFLISAAGTGGHVFPALEFGRECIKNDHEVLWIGTKIGIENRVLPQNIKLFTIPMKGFRGKNLIFKVASLIGLVASIFKRDRDNLEHMPNQKWHQIVSFIKSGIRLAGYGLLLYSVPIAVGVLIFSEIIGIIEELV